MQLRSARFNWAQLDSTKLSSIQTELSSIQLSPAQFNLEIQLRLQFEAMILGVF